MTIKITLISAILFLCTINPVAQITEITRFPFQFEDMDYLNATPLSLSEYEILIFFESQVDRSIYSSLSTNGGIDWQNPQIVVDEVGSRYMTAVKTNSSRIIVAWIPKNSLGLYFVLSDNDGTSWSTTFHIQSPGSSFPYRKPLLDLSLSQSLDNTIWLCVRTTEQKLFYLTSNDNGNTWSDYKMFFEPASNEFKYGYLSIDSKDVANLIAVYQDSLTGSSNIYQIFSSDGGESWSNAEPIVNSELDETFPRLLRDNDGALWVTYQISKPTEIEEFNQSDIYYIKSTNGGANWSEPEQFTVYIGDDNLTDADMFNNKPILTLVSKRYSEKNKISFGIVSESEDTFNPPVIYSIVTSEPLEGESITVQAQIIDDTEVSDVSVNLDLESLKLFDDGQHYDAEPHDNIYGNEIPVSKLNQNLAVVQYIDVNNIKLPMDNKGVFADRYDGNKSILNCIASDPIGNNSRLHKEINFSQAIQYGAMFDDQVFLYSSGFFLSGYNNNYLWANGVASSNAVNDYLPGNVGSDPRNFKNSIYTIKNSDPAFGNSWQNWRLAVEQGANFYDGDGNGIYNPVDINWDGIWNPGEDMPDLLGDITAWCVYNDGVHQNHRRWDSEPQGIEIRQTVFASGSIPELSNVIFIRYSILNTGMEADILDSVFFSIQEDPDLGDHRDDLVACDTLLNACLTYNDSSDDNYGMNPPAFFTSILQGPTQFTGSSSDTAYNLMGNTLGVNEFNGYQNLRVTSHVHHIGGDPDLNPPSNSVDVRNYMLGLTRTGTIVDPCDWWPGLISGGIDCNLVNNKFWYSGDPVTNFGWMNRIPLDQRNMMSTGPFELEKEKPVDIIVAYIMGRGTDALNSIAVAREITAAAIEEYGSNFASLTYKPGEPIYPINNYILYQNYPNPFNPSTTIRYEIPQDGIVKIIIYDILGREIKTILNEFKYEGRYDVEIDGSNLAGGLASGIYFYRLEVADFVDVKKMILLK